MRASLRNAVCERARNCCEYCQMQAVFSHDPFSAEHILPIAKSGLDELINLAWACLGCNLYKSSTTHVIDLISGDLVPLFNPRMDKWSEHFQWTEGFAIIVGLTPIGRATITCLKLNRLGLINLRKLLVAFDKHPPVL